MFLLQDILHNKFELYKNNKKKKTTLLRPLFDRDNMEDLKIKENKKYNKLLLKQTKIRIVQNTI